MGPGAAALALIAGLMGLAVPQVNAADAINDTVGGAVGNDVAVAVAVTRCVFCHGDGGRSLNPIWPVLAGQPETYLADQLRAYAKGPDGPRRNLAATQMYALAAALDEAAIGRLARHYAAERPRPARPRRGGGPEQRRAETLHRAGTEAVPACASCHGRDGEGDEMAGAPRLAGQHGRYFVAQMAAYRAGTRDDPTGAMGAIAAALDDDAVRALAGFYAGAAGWGPNTRSR